MDCDREEEQLEAVAKRKLIGFVRFCNSDARILAR